MAIGRRVNNDQNVRQASQPSTTPAQMTPIDSLSIREREVLDLASHGSTNNEIGQHLGLTVHAVKFHLASVYRKLGVANRTEATAAFLTLRHAAAAVSTDGEAR